MQAICTCSKILLLDIKWSDLIDTLQILMAAKGVKWRRDSIFVHVGHSYLKPKTSIGRRSYIHSGIGKLWYPNDG